MLSTHKKDQLRVTIQDFNLSNQEKNGLPIIDDKPVPVPSIDELKRTAFNQIREQGFSLIMLVPETDADCIIRVYQKKHYPYSPTSIWNIYGYQCFTRKTKGFKTISIYGKKEPFCKSKCSIKLWTSDDEYVDIDCTYKDFFIKVQ